MDETNAFQAWGGYKTCTSNFDCEMSILNQSLAHLAACNKFFLPNETEAKNLCTCTTRYGLVGPTCSKPTDQVVVVFSGIVLAAILASIVWNARLFVVGVKLKTLKPGQASFTVCVCGFGAQIGCALWTFFRMQILAGNTYPRYLSGAVPMLSITGVFLCVQMSVLILAWKFAMESFQQKKGQFFSKHIYKLVGLNLVFVFLSVNAAAMKQLYTAAGVIILLDLCLWVAIYNIVARKVRNFLMSGSMGSKIYTPIITVTRRVTLAVLLLLLAMLCSTIFAERVLNNTGIRDFAFARPMFFIHATVTLFIITFWGASLAMTTYSLSVTRTKMSSVKSSKVLASNS